jgi:hypothetical protein
MKSFKNIKKIITILLVACIPLTIIGCGSSEESTQTEKKEDNRPDITLTNLTTVEFTKMYIFQQATSSMGDDYLETRGHLLRGDEMSIKLPNNEDFAPGMYNIMCEDKDGNKFYFNGISLPSTASFFLTMDSNGNTQVTSDEISVSKADTETEAATGDSNYLSLTVINNTELTLSAIYITPDNNISLDNNLLSGKTLDTGSNTSVAVPKNIETDSYTITITDDGENNIYFPNVNISSANTVTLSFDDDGTPKAVCN